MIEIFKSDKSEIKMLCDTIDNKKNKISFRKLI